MPVLEALAGEVPVSIDTAKAEVARRALALGAELVNDVTALRGDPDLAGVVAGSGAYLCLMHMRGEPRTMQVDPATMTSSPRSRRSSRSGCASRSTRVPEERICLDPGIGFGKTRRAQLRADRASRRAARARAAGARRLLAQVVPRPASRRSGRDDRPALRLLAAAVAAYERGATILRVHDVREHVEALHGRGGRRDDASSRSTASGLRPARRPRRRSGARQPSSSTSSSRLGRRRVSDGIEDAVDYREVADWCARSPMGAKPNRFASYGDGGSW